MESTQIIISTLLSITIILLNINRISYIKQKFAVKVIRFTVFLGVVAVIFMTYISNLDELGYTSTLVLTIILIIVSYEIILTINKSLASNVKFHNSMSDETKKRYRELKKTLKHTKNFGKEINRKGKLRNYYQYVKPGIFTRVTGNVTISVTMYTLLSVYQFSNWKWNSEMKDNLIVITIILGSIVMLLVYFSLLDIPFRENTILVAEYNNMRKFLFKEDPIRLYLENSNKDEKKYNYRCFDYFGMIVSVIENEKHIRLYITVSLFTELQLIRYHRITHIDDSIPKFNILTKIVQESNVVGRFILKG